jgi:adhesin/invasin
LVANGTNTASISVLVTEAVTNTAVPNTTVQFSTTLGSIPPAATTNESGVATAQLTAGTSSGTATVTATLGSRSNTATVNMLPPDLTVTLTASSTSGSILRDNIDSVNLTVAVQDPDGKFLNNLTASWSTNAGTVFPTTGQTGADGSEGRHTTTLTSDAGAADQTSTVTVTVGDSSRSTDIIFRGISLLPIGVQPDTILANGTTGIFTWQAVETTTGVLIKGHDVTITKQSGPSVVMSSVSNITDSGGIARASATSTTSSGDLVLRASLGGVTQDQTLTILADQLDVVLSTDEPVLLRDGEESARLTATVSDRFGDPVSNQRVDFVLVGDGALDRPFARTDANGEAWVTLTADVSSTNSNAQITATSGAANDVLNVPLFGVQLSITANPSTIVADRSETAVIEATLKETGGNTPLVGRVITFSVTPGTFGSITAQATTNGLGIATAVMTADTTDTFASTVTARLGNDPSITLTASTTVDITAPSLSVTFPTALRGGPILRNGLDSSTLTVRVLGNGQPLVSKVVDWSITAGSGTLSVGSGLTNSTGEATVILTGDTGTTDVTTTVQASVEGTSATLDVTLQGVSMQLTATPDIRTANGTSTSTVKAVLFRTTANTPIEEQEITFSTTLGTVIGQETTNDNGEAIVTFTAGTTAGTATITSDYRAFLTDTETITLLPSIPFALAMEADPIDLIADGEGTPTTSTITVTVLDTLGAPVPLGTSVDLSVSPDGVFGNNTTSITKTTDTAGQASAIYRAGTSSGTMEFTATSGTITVVDELIHVASGLPDHILIGDPSTATDLGDGQGSFTVGVTVASATNAAIEGIVINFSLTGAGNDTVATITSGANTVTDEDGVATATITFPLGQAGNTIEVTVTTGDGSVTEVKTITLPTP